MARISFPQDPWARLDEPVGAYSDLQLVDPKERLSSRHEK